MFELLEAELGDVGGELGIILTEIPNLAAVMAVDCSFDRLGLSERSLLGQKRGTCDQG